MSIDFKIKDTLTPTLRKRIKANDPIRSFALTQVGLKLWDDTINQVPKPPIDEGNLRGSGVLMLGNDVIAQGEYTGNASRKTSTSKDMIFGMDVVYAAYQHELPFYATHNRPQANAGSGPKFLQRKLERHGQDYIEMAGIIIDAEQNKIR